MSKNKVVFDVLANSSQYQSQMLGIEKSTDKTSKAVTASFAAASITIGATLTAFAKYETMLIKVGKTADIQGKELNNFGKEVVALSSKIPLSTNELLDLSASAAQLGVKGKDNILKFTETVAKLGTATDIVGEEGSKAIARLLNVTGEGIGTVDKFGAIITRLGNSTAASESEILSMASRVGKATAQFDLGTTAVLGISAALREVGVEAELGGSAIGRTFAEIQNAVFNGGEAMDTFSNITGLSAAQIKEVFEKDATQAFQIFIEALNKLPAEQVASSMESMGLEGVRLREVIGTLAKRSELLANSLNLASDEAEKQTALNEEFGRAVNSLENSFKFFKNEVVNLAASMGKDLAPEAKALIQDITAMIKGIREFNEATGGAVTTSIVMAAKISALILVVNKLKAVLVATGIVSATMATGMGAATTATNIFTSSATLGAKANNAFAFSFLGVTTGAKRAALAMRTFNVSLGAVIGGLYIAVELGLKLGKVIGKMGELNTSEQDLIKAQTQLNNLMDVRVKLQEKIAAGDTGAQARLDSINKEIAKREGLIAVIQKEVDARKGGGEGGDSAAAPDQVPAMENTELADLATRESEKTAILESEIGLRVEAAAREAELLAQINKGMTAEAIKNAEEKNDQLNDIAEKKAEIDRLNLDLGRENIDANEKAILELKRQSAVAELGLMEEKFEATQAKSAEQDAIDAENRLAAQVILRELTLEQDAMFREEDLLLGEERREEDLELKTVRAEEDLIFLQNKLITEKQAEDTVRRERMTNEAARRNQFLKDEVQYGKTIATLKMAQTSREYETTKTSFEKLSQLRGAENSKAAGAAKAFALYDIGVKTAQAAISAFNAMAPIPFVGPALGAAAAATAIAFGMKQAQSVQSQGSFAVGTDYVPNDMVANIHAGEAIVPAKQNQFLQSGDLVLGSPDAMNSSNENNSSNVVNINFEGATFIGNVGEDDAFINQVFDGIATGINEGRLPGFEDSPLAVTG